MTMIPLLNICSGSEKMDILDINRAMTLKWTPSLSVQKGGGYFVESALVEGRELRQVVLANVSEKLPIILIGCDADDIGEIQHQLNDFRRLMRRFFTLSLGRPVYLEYSESDQSHPQYALIKNWDITSQNAAFDYIQRTLGGEEIYAGTLILEREPTWRDNIPGTVPAALAIGGSSSPVTRQEIYIPNVRETAVLTHIYRFQAVGSVFGANLIASSAFNIFAGVPALNDICYFGSTQGLFRNVVLNLSPVRTGTATVDWEYWNGASWSTLTIFGAEDGTNLLQGDGLGTAGLYVLKIQEPVTWAMTVINGVNAYWVRAKIIGSGTMPNIPAQSGQVVYNAIIPTVDIASTLLNGDVDALVRMLFNAKNAGLAGRQDYGIFQIIAGLKTRGLTNFVSHLNFGGGNPSGWTVTPGTDASVTANINSPNGNRITVSFATDLTLTLPRATIATTTPAIASDYAGAYNVYLRVNQTTGTVGQVAVKLRVVPNSVNPAQSGMSWLSELVYLRDTTTSSLTVECLFMGTVNLPLLQDSRALIDDQTQLMSELKFIVYAQAENATPDLWLYDVVVVPVDEMVLGVEAPDLGGTLSQGIQSVKQLIVDGGLVGQGAQLGLSYLTPANIGLQWILTAAPPTLPPDLQARLFILFNISGLNAHSSIVSGCNFSLYAHQRWDAYRGDE